jgi:spermidine synthase
MKRPHILLLIKFIAAFCSISYELILAQTLSAFLSNTVLRYCITIGLYMFCMGLGAFVIGKRLLRAPGRLFWQTEVALTLIGASVVPLLFVVDAFQVSAWKGGTLVFFFVAHALICVIGFLTGFELPLSMELAKRDGGPARNSLFAVDYLGAFVGTVAFAFVFYPFWGLVASAWYVSLLNALAALALVRSWREGFDASPRALNWVSLVLILAAIGGLATVSFQEKFLLGIYLR